MAVTILNVNDTTFSINGIEYLKNFMSIVEGDNVKILNVYDSKVVLQEPTNYADYTVDAAGFASAILLQADLKDVLFYRATTLNGITEITTEAELDVVITNSTAGTWLITGDIVLTGNKTITQGVTLEFVDSKFTGAFTITFDQNMVLSNTQCFTSDQTFAGSLSSNINPEWFGASRDGATDDTIAINGALEMADDLGGHTVELLVGVYYVDSRKPTLDYCLEVFSNTSLIGQGMFQSILKVGANVVVDTPLILTNSASNLVFKNFELDGNKTRLAVGVRGTGEDEGIDIKGGSNIIISNLYIHDFATDAIDLDQVALVGEKAVINNCLIEDNGGIGIHNNFDNCQINNNIITNNAHDRLANNTGQVALDACGVDAKGDYITISNNIITSNAVGVNLAGVNNPVLTGNTISQNGDYNVVVGAVISTLGPVNALIEANNIKSSLYGIYVKSSQEGLYMYNNIIRTQGSNAVGVLIEDSNQFEIIGGQVGDYFSIEVQSVDNLSTISTTFVGGDSNQAGVRVLPGASGNLVIRNCIDDLNFNQAVDLRGLVNGCIIKNNTFNNRKGIRMLNSGGNPSNITIKDNDTTTMTIVGSGHVIKRNTGYVTEGYGTSTIADTNSTVLITHGLNITPTKIGLTSAGNELIWYSGITSTQFTVNRAGTTGALNFSWEAE